jgi:hypothetical protein
MEFSMTSVKQLAANRANAKRSTGPKTKNGKARSKRNAVKHGLAAKQAILIEGEDPEDFEALSEDLIAKHRPSSAFAHELVMQIAVTTWRWRRVQRLEAAFIRACQKEARNEVEAAFVEDYYGPLREEAASRCVKSIEKNSEVPVAEKLNALARAYLDGTYDERFKKFYEEVKTEAKERGCEPPNRTLTEEELADVYQAGALDMLLDDDRSDVLRKLSRYETSLLNNIFRIQRLLEAEQKLIEVIDV